MIFENSNDLRLKNGLYKSCRSQPDLQFCSWNFFQMRLFWHPNAWFKFRISIFQNFQMTSDGKIVYMKVVGSDQIYNFVVQKFFSWGCFGTQIYGLNFKFQIFKISKWPQMEKKVYTKVVARHQIYNFVVEKFFISHRYSCETGYTRY